MANERKISVEGLFGFLDHSIELKEDGVTFIHGPNGCGKTSILKLISAFYNWDVIDLFSINYKKMIVEYESDNRIEIVRTNESREHKDISDDLDDEEPIFIIFTYYEKAKKPRSFEIDNRGRYGIHEKIRMNGISRNDIEEALPFLRRISSTSWVDIRTNERLSYPEIFERYVYRTRFGRIGRKSPTWMAQLQEDTKLHFVQTQRLFKVNAKKRSMKNNMVDIYSDDLRDRISTKLADFVAVSQTRDRSFPDRLLSKKSNGSLSEEMIRAEYKKTEEKIEQLMHAGLIEKEKNISLPAQGFKAMERKVLSLYLEDINEKLSVFDDLLEKINTFLDVVSGKLRNKKFSINKQHGFSIESNQKIELKPSELSSGEQHLIVLFYELIFKEEGSSFFLIAEPEISLHIDWQRQFLSDIYKIATLRKHQFLIATHSPQIIGDRRELAIALDGEGIGTSTA